MVKPGRKNLSGQFAWWPTLNETSKSHRPIYMEITNTLRSLHQSHLLFGEFWLQVRDVWQTYELELVNYQNKCRIIRGWDDLFTKVKEHINSVSAMKLSPYYKVHVGFFMLELSSWSAGMLLRADYWLLSLTERELCIASWNFAGTQTLILTCKFAKARKVGQASLWASPVVHSNEY